MKRMNVNVLKRLENIQNHIQISMYLPISQGPQNTSKNVSMLHYARSLLRKTLIAEQVPHASQELVIQHMTNLEQELSHPMSGKSLAIFILESNEMLVYELSYAIDNAIYFMAPNLQLEPLKAHYRDTAAYWVLSLSQKGCTLFKGAGNSLKKVNVAGLSQDLKTALRLDEVNDPDIQAHSVGGGHGDTSEGYHGHGGFKDTKKKYLENYLRLMDKRLGKYLHNDNAPVILVGVDYTQNLFAKLSKHSRILTSKISMGSKPESISIIREAVQPLVANLQRV